MTPSPDGRDALVLAPAAPDVTSVGVNCESTCVCNKVRVCVVMVRSMCVGIGCPTIVFVDDTVGDLDFVHVVWVRTGTAKWTGRIYGAWNSHNKNQ